MGSILALALIAAGVLGYVITGPAPKVVEAQPIPITGEAAQRLDDKIEALRREIHEACLRGESTEFTLVITEEEASSKVMQLAFTDQINLDIKYAQCYFREGRAKCSGKVDVVLNLDISIEAEIKVKEGKPDINVKGLHIGRLPVTATLVDQIMRAVTAHYQERLDATEAVLDEITIGDGELIVKGHSKP